MAKPKQDSWYAEFEHFASIAEDAPPTELSAQICGRIKYDLQPSELRVFSRLALVHTLAGSATLFICPQFGLGFTAHHAGLMAFFMKLGPVGCMAACGAFFLGTSALIAGSMLKPEELRVLRRSRLLQLLGLSLASLGVFFCLGGELVPFELGAAWLAGSLCASVPGLETALSLRFRGKKALVCAGNS